MKKSILNYLLAVVAVCFAGISMAQNPWPTTLPLGTPSDTMFFCSSPDSLYPVEFGYDIAGKYLSPSYGDWELYAVTGAQPVSYDFGANKNGGAGNTFRVVGEDYGGYVFRYTSNNDQCGLDDGDEYFIFVFIMPDLATTVTQGDTVCRVPAGNHAVTYANNFIHKDLYAKAGFTLTFNPTGFTQSIDAKGIFVHTSDFTLTPNPHGNYNCGYTGQLKYTVTVIDSIDNWVGKILDLCPEDTIGGAATRSLKTLLGRNFVSANYSLTNGGTQNIITIADLANWGTLPAKKEIYLNYVDPCTGTAKVVVDTVHMGRSFPDDFHGQDTITLCRRDSIGDLYDIYDMSTKFGVPHLAKSSFDWTDWGITGQNPINYMTHSGLSSLINHKDINLKDMFSETYYHYNWTVLDPTCFQGDSGRIVLYLQDPIIASDYRLQMCNSYAGIFDFNAFINISGASWSDGNDNPISGTLTAAEVAALPLGVSEFKYSLNDLCSSGSAVFYIKKTKNPVISTSVVEKYCIAYAPSKVNLNDVLGFVDAGTWAITSATKFGGGSVTIPATHLNTATGVLDVASVKALLGIPAGVDAEVVLTMTNTGSCAPSTATVKLVFTQTL